MILYTGGAAGASLSVNDSVLAFLAAMNFSEAVAIFTSFNFGVD